MQREDDAREDGIEQGIERGIEQGIGQGIEQGIFMGKQIRDRELVINMYGKGFSMEDIIQVTEIPLEKSWKSSSRFSSNRSLVNEIGVKI